MSPRGRRLSRVASAAALALLPALAGLEARAATHGLVVGVNDYHHLRSLKGAVNDAEDIAIALREAGAENVTLLLDAEATRERILEAWSDIVEGAEPGDTVVFSYAGHGGQEPERIAGSEEDGLDEVFLLSGFQETAPGNRQRIRDDEINALFSERDDLVIVFVADSCHSGTMERSIALGTRLGSYGPIVDDELPPPAKSLPPAGGTGLEHVVFFGAVQDGELALEFSIDGKSRGALSYAFARALRGRADADEDGLLDTRELESYLVENVRMLSEGRQLPQMLPRGRPVQVALPISDWAGEPADETPLTLRLSGAEAPDALVGSLQGVALAEADAEDDADLAWDLETGDVTNAGDEAIATLEAGPSVEAFQGVVDKWRLLRDLRALAETRPLALRLDKRGELYRKGDRPEFLLKDSAHPKLTLFNLAVDGTVQFIAPDPSANNRLYHGDLIPGDDFAFPLRVTGPFGADHLVALTSPEGLPALERVLKGYDQDRRAEELRQRLPRLLADQTYQLGVAALYSTR